MGDSPPNRRAQEFRKLVRRVPKAITSLEARLTPTGIKETTRTFGLVHVLCATISDGSAVWDAYIVGRLPLSFQQALSFGCPRTTGLA